MVVNMKEMLQKAKDGHYAVPAINTQGGHFDITYAICKAAAAKKSPMILAHYDSCSAYAGLDYFVDSCRWCAKKMDIPVAIHLDHGDSVELCKRAIDAGFSSVMFDGSAMDLQDNINATLEVMDYAASREVTVEAELGRLLRGVEATKGDVNANCADPEEIRTFLSAVTPDALAVAIGNAHGFYLEKPVLNYALLEELNKEFPVPLVLHGGTGIPVEDVQRAIRIGISKVNVATEFRVNYVKYYQEAINTMGIDEHAFKLSMAVIDRLQKDIEATIDMCMSAGKV